MAHNNGVITAPISLVDDVEAVIGTANHDLGSLCLKNNINIGSLCKPMQKTGQYNDEPIYVQKNTKFNYDILGNAIDSIFGYNDKDLQSVFGITMPCRLETNDDGLSNYVNVINLAINAFETLQQADYLKMWAYNKPSVYRLTDFNGYNNKQRSVIDCSYDINTCSTYNLIQLSRNYQNSSASQLKSSNLFPTINIFTSYEKIINRYITISVNIKDKTAQTTNIPFYDIGKILFYDNSSEITSTDTIKLFYKTRIINGSKTMVNDDSDDNARLNVSVVDITSSSTNNEIKIPVPKLVSDLAGVMELIIGLARINVSTYMGSNIYRVKKAIIPENGYNFFKFVYAPPTRLIHMRAYSFNSYLPDDSSSSQQNFNGKVNTYFDFYSDAEVVEELNKKAFCGIAYNQTTDLASYHNITNCVFLYALIKNGNNNKSFLVKFKMRKASGAADGPLDNDNNKMICWGYDPLNSNHRLYENNNTLYYCDSTYKLPNNIGYGMTPPSSVKEIHAMNSNSAYILRIAYVLDVTSGSSTSITNPIFSTNMIYVSPQNLGDKLEVTGQENDLYNYYLISQVAYESGLNYQ